MMAVAAGERWLRGVLADEPSVDVDAIRRRVHLALDEVWLADELKDELPAGLVSRTRAAVRAAVKDDAEAGAGLSGGRGTSRPQRSPKLTVHAGWRTDRPYGWAGGALAAAAAVALALLIPSPGADQPAPRTEPLLAAAFRSLGQQDDVREEISDIRSRLTRLEREWSRPIGSGVSDRMIEDTRQRLDGLMEDFSLEARWPS